MNRSSWKLPYLNYSFFRFMRRPLDKSITTWSRGSTFLYPHLNKTFKIYNGRKFVSVQIKKPFLGYYSGDFCMTKYLGKKIHLRKKKKKLSSKK